MPVTDAADAPPIATIEPSGWNDSLEEPDVAIPVAAIGEVIDVSDDEADDCVQYVPASTATTAGCPPGPHACGDHWHFRANVRPFAEFRVPLPPGYTAASALLEGSIRQRTEFRYEAIAVQVSNPNAPLDDRSIWAYMSRVGRGSSARCAVYSPMYIPDQRLAQAMFPDSTHDFTAYVCGDLSRPDVIAIPIYHPGMTHWTLGIYDASGNILHYFDPMLGPLDEQTRIDLLAAVNNFYPHGSWSDGSAPFVNVVPHASYNAQTDAVNGGFLTCLLWEQWMSASHHPTLIQPLCMAHERQRIINNLVNIFVGDDQPFLPLPAPTHPLEPLETRRASLPHAALLDRIQLAMENPLPSGVTLLFLPLFKRCLNLKYYSDGLFCTAGAGSGSQEEENAEQTPFRVHALRCLFMLMMFTCLL